MIFTVANQKGGVGKTTTTISLGVYLANMGKKVLLIDLDPQANLTSGLGFSVDPPENLGEEVARRKCVYDVLIEDATISQIFLATDIENLHIAPSSIDLAGAEIELVNVMSRESALKRKVSEISSQYDFVFIDCPPSLGLLTINALTASDGVVIPVQCEYFALEGLSQLLNTVNMVKSNLNKSLKIAGVILTMFDKRTRLASEVAQEVQNFFGDKVFETVIPRNVRLSEAPSHGKSIADYDASSRGARAYHKLAEEFVNRFD